MLEKRMKLPINVKIRLIMLFIQNISTTSIFPFMALLLTAYIGGKKTGIVLIIGILIKVSASIIGGYISDGLKIKKFFLSIITSMSALMFLGMGWILLHIETSTENNKYIYIFVILYFINEFINATSKPIYNAFALDYVEDNIRKNYAKMKYWISNVSLAIGMMIGGIFYSSFKTYLFVFIFLCLSINVFILLTFVKERVNEKASFQKKFISQLFFNYIKAYRNTPYVILLFCGVLILSAEMSLSSYISVRLGNGFKEIDFGIFLIDGARMFSILLIVNTLMVFFFSFFILNRLKNFSDVISLKIGFVFYLAGYTTITFSNNFYILIIFMIFATVGEIIFTPIYESEKIKRIPPLERGSHSALDNLVITGAELISRIFLILGAFVSPVLMAMIIFIIIFLGFTILIKTVSDD
ncbi:TPA: MFS transporter [Staphylococcus aureus]